MFVSLRNHGRWKGVAVNEGIRGTGKSHIYRHPERTLRESLPVVAALCSLTSWEGVAANLTPIAPDVL